MTNWGTSAGFAVYAACADVVPMYVVFAEHSQDSRKMKVDDSEVKHGLGMHPPNYEQVPARGELGLWGPS